MSTVKKVPMRKCVGCNAMKSKKEMVRVVKDDITITIDATGKKNGRGAYICFCENCLTKAEKNKGLERSLKCAIPKEIYDSLKKELSELEPTK